MSDLALFEVPDYRAQMLNVATAVSRVNTHTDDRKRKLAAKVAELLYESDYLPEEATRSISRADFLNSVLAGRVQHSKDFRRQFIDLSEAIRQLGTGAGCRQKIAWRLAVVIEGGTVVCAQAGAAFDIDRFMQHAGSEYEIDPYYEGGRWWCVLDQDFERHEGSMADGKYVGMMVRYPAETPIPLPL